jgi:hypothetical protein
MRWPTIRTLAFLITVMRDHYRLTPALVQLRSQFAVSRTRDRDRRAPTILIQCVEDYFYFALFGKITAGLRACGPLRVDQYSSRSLRAGSSLSLRRLFWNYVQINSFSDRKWRWLYGGFTDRTAYHPTGWLAPWVSIYLWWAAWRLWRGINTVDNLIELKAQKIWIGDLVVDSYIRFKPAPMPDLNDPYLLVVIRQALKDVANSLRYFRRQRPSLLLTSYTTYIQHGIAARVAVHENIPVRAFSNLQDFSTEITRHDLWHTRDGRNYKVDFSALPDKCSKLAVAEEQLNQRMAGKIDAATSYMKNSAYGGTAQADFDVRGMPVIFLHDFYDSVHIYRWISFHDFWSWVCFTVDTLRSAKIPFALKPHPNQLISSSDVMDLLLAKYPDLNMVPAGVTNDQLIRGGMACAVTVYGTVASEMAFMGVPTISCGDNPHVSFDFCHTARTRGEYAQLLLNYRSLPTTPAQMRQESCAFYYMHNLHLTPEEQSLKDKMLELRRRLFFVNAPPSPREIIEAATEFASGPALHAYCKSIYGLIRDQASRDSAGRA